MCLDLPDLERRTLAKGLNFGFEWQVVHNDLGHRCGYLRVEPGHPWFGKDYDDVTMPGGDDVDVHGGLTFAEAGTACPTHGPEAEWWVGFDCGHAGDAVDFTLLSAPCDPADVGTVVDKDEQYARLMLEHRERMDKLFADDAKYPMPEFMRPKIRDTEYVSVQCRQLAAQAFTALNGA